VAALPQCRLLVFVAQPGHKADVTSWHPAIVIK
jgi:hypothetical protein